MVCLSLPANLPAVQAYFIYTFHILLEAPSNLKHDRYMMNMTSFFQLPQMSRQCFQLEISTNMLLLP